MLVVCCGNADRGDDAAGPLVARRLRKVGIAACEHSGEALSLIDMWRGAGEVVLVDAVVTGKRCGSVSVWDPLAAPLAGPAALTSSHSLGLAAAVALARTMGWLPRRLTLYGIEARRFDLGRPPSNAVLRGVAEVARRIHEHSANQRGPAV
jgi:hydrogenase maturation protease